jgi:hypothetical protein
MNIMHRNSFALVVSLFCVASCSGQERAAPLFRLLPPEQTGVSFANTITTDDSVNVQMDSFVYNGGGVAIGDIDNDGLADIYLTGNMISSRLYANDGGMRFTDITESAGLVTDRWATGASLVDIDGNGYLDIYVSVSGPKWTPAEARANLLFLNNGDRTFTEAAAAFGIADTSFTTHAVFLDYDGDGALDLFVLNNDPAGFARGEAERHPAGLPSTDPVSHDRLYRNSGRGRFTDVSAEAGILQTVGFGLGVEAADLNRDGWPDIYISNDDTPSDVLYVNNGDGTFSDRAGAWLRHTSFAGMGIDIADFNNDGWLDVLQTDMVPEDLEARKRSTGALDHAGRMELRRRGFHADYPVNTLQLNLGLTASGDLLLSEIGRMAGIAYTGWSWSALFADYDNDGYKDILITNGYPKAVIDYDYQVQMYAVRRRGDDRTAQVILDTLQGYELPNYAFRNTGDLTFANATDPWGMDRPSFSYGAAYADLDNDGRLDVVINNINAPAFVYHNVGPANEERHFLQVRLEGEPPNIRGLGSTVAVTGGGRRQYIYHTPYRGYQSSMDHRIHFGLGTVQRVDSLEVVWPDGRSQVLTDLQVDRVVTVRQSDATPGSGLRGMVPADDPLFQPVTDGTVPAYLHRASQSVDFRVQPLLPYQVSKQGPPLAVGDVNGDGLEDVFVGGAANAPGTLFVQQADGRFIASVAGQPWEADRRYDDWGATFVDADGDGLLDLYVATGGYHPSPGSTRLQDRFYRNEGGGRFVRDSLALPPMWTSTARVAAADFTGDGRPDLFVGGSLLPRSYPLPTRSYLLRNDGDRFTDVTEEVAPDLISPGGMVTDALWVDFTADGRPDLVTAGTWMPVQFYEHDGERLQNVTARVAPAEMRGWWYRLASGDFNADGHPDLVAGNVGLNFGFTTSTESRFGVYAADFTGNLTTDIVFTQEIDGAEYPFYGLAKLGRAIYTVSVPFSTFAAFAGVPVQQVFSAAQLEQAVHRQVDTFASVYLQNDGSGTFAAVPLPRLAQLAPIHAILVYDADADGHTDLLVAGNQYHTEPNTASADAGNGLWLRGDGRGGLTPVSPLVSGFLAPLQVADLALIATPAGPAVLVANTGDSLRAFRVGGR